MFVLNERLEADCVFVTDWPLCRVLLMNDANFPWLILVPRRHGVTEMHELDRPDREALTEEIATAAHRLQILLGAKKMNVAALGNVVSQLHVHVIARHETDAAWPRPIWGVVPTKPYEPAALDEMVDSLREALS